MQHEGENAIWKGNNTSHLSGGKASPPKLVSCSWSKVGAEPLVAKVGLLVGLLLLHRVVEVGELCINILLPLLCLHDMFLECAGYLWLAAQDCISSKWVHINTLERRQSNAIGWREVGHLNWRSALPRRTSGLMLRTLCPTGGILSWGSIGLIHLHCRWRGWHLLRCHSCHASRHLAWKSFVQDSSINWRGIVALDNYTNRTPVR